MKLLFRFFRRLPWFLASLTVLVGILLLGVSLLGRHPLYEELPDFDYRSKVLELMESGRYAEAETLIDDLLDCHWYADRHELEVWRTYCRKSRPGAAAAFAAGFLTGSVDSAGAASGAIVGDLLIWGDLRDLAAQGFFLASGQETDPWLSALSALGLATEIVPQGDMLSSGLKVLRKAGALSPKLVRRVISAAGKLAKGTLSAADRKLFAHLRLLLDKCGLPRCRTIFKVIDSDKKAAALARAAAQDPRRLHLALISAPTAATAALEKVSSRDGIARVLASSCKGSAGVRLVRRHYLVPLIKITASGRAGQLLRQTLLSRPEFRKKCELIGVGLILAGVAGLAGLTTLSFRRRNSHRADRP